MIKTFAIISLLIVSSLALRSVPSNIDELRTLWSSWKIYHGKSYSLVEEASRFAIFLENYKTVTEFNAKSESAKLSLNKFADLTPEEFKLTYTSPIPDERRPFGNGYIPDTTDYSLLGDLPTSIDWRTKGAVPPVQNQGQCGSPWVYTAISTLESLYFIDSGSLVSLSGQQLIDCVAPGQGCTGGGTVSKAYAYTAKYGIETEEDYPYTDIDDSCHYDASKAIKINSGFQWVQFNNAAALKAALVNQPVAVAIEADQSVFQMYTSGVITTGCGTAIDHYVTVVGYEVVGGIEAFIVQNSWGTSWGQSGYAYITTNASVNGGEGECGIFTSPVVPLK